MSNGAAKQGSSGGVDMRVTVRFSGRDQELFNWLFFGQPEPLSRVVLRALYEYSGVPGGEYLGVAAPGSTVTQAVSNKESDLGGDAERLLDGFLTRLAGLVKDGDDDS